MAPTDENHHRDNKENNEAVLTGLRSLIRAFPDEDQQEMLDAIEGSIDKVKPPQHDVEKRYRTIREEIHQSVKEIFQHAMETQIKQEKQLEMRVGEYLTEMRNAQQLLNVPESTVDFTDDTSIGLYQREISLKVRCEKLVSVRNERESTWTELSSTNRKLASAIGRPAFSVEPNLRLRTEVLDTLRVKNDELSAAFKTRLERLRGVKGEIKMLMADLEKAPTTDIEHALFTEPEGDFPLTDGSFERVAALKEKLFSDKLALTEEMMQLRDKSQAIRRRLKLDELDSGHSDERSQKICPTNRDKLRKELDKLEILKHQNMKKFILELRVELYQLQVKCLLGGNERNLFTWSKTEVFDEECLEHHEAECQRLREYFKQNADLFTKIVRREEVWEKKMEMEDKEADPSRFNNRGGQLLRDQQEKAKVEHELKRLDADLREKMNQWLAEKHTPFRCYGTLYADFVQDQKVQYEQKREQEREERKRAKDASGVASMAGKRKLDHHVPHPPAKSSIQKTIGVAGLTQRSPKVQRTGPHGEH